MAIMDELKRLVRPYNDDEDDYDEDEVEEEVDEEEEEEEAPAKPVRAARREAPAAAPARTAAARPAPAAAPAQAPAALGNVNGLRTNNNLQMILVKPERYDEVSGIANHLRNKSAVVLNLEVADRASAKRIVDFLSGCAYALEGNIKKVATSTYVITPFNVDVVGELTAEDIENTSITY